MLCRLNLKKSIINWGMLVSCSISFVILFRVYIMFGYTHKMDNLDILSITMIPLAMSGYIPFACIFPILPYGFSYLEERNSGYIKSILARTSKNKYILNKIIFTGLSGGLAVCIPFLLIFIYTDFIGARVTRELYPAIFLEHIWGQYMFIWGGRFVLLCRLAIIFLYGCVWAECALLISIICPNRYVVFLSPFIIYQIMWITFSDGLLIFLNPVLLFRSDFAAGTPLYLPFVIQFLILFIMSILIYITMKHRVKDV